MATTTAVRTAEFDKDSFPVITLTETKTITSAGVNSNAITQTSFQVVVSGVDGIDPTRDLTAEELAAGISSLNPPTVTALEDTAKLVESAGRALESAVSSSGRPLLSPEHAMTIRYKVAVGVNACLRSLDYDV